MKAPRAAKSTTLGGNQSKAHTALVRDIRLALGDEPDLVLWPMQPGGVSDSTGRPIRTGPTGMADLCGVLAPQGRWFCLEVKTGAAQQTKGQRLWSQLVTDMGACYRVVRSVEEAQAALVAARRGEA